MRYVSICPSNTEFLHYLGLTNNIVGIDDFSDWPTSIEHLPRLGPDLAIEMDKVEALKPDLVFASLSVPGMERNIEELKRRRIPHVIVPNPKTLSEISDVLQFVGEVTDKTKVAEQLTHQFSNVINSYHYLSNRVKKKKTIYWEWWPKPVFTPGRDNWLTEMSELAGGQNVFDDSSQASIETDWNDVQIRRPDVIAVVWVGVQKERVNPHVIKKRPGWEELDAIKNDSLYILDEPLFCRPSPRLLLGLMEIAHLLHPDVYPAYAGEKKDPLLNVL